MLSRLTGARTRCFAKQNGGKNADPLAAVVFSHRGVLFISGGTPEMDEPIIYKVILANEENFDLSRHIVP